MKLAKEAEKELLDFKNSHDLRNDMEKCRTTWKNAFLKNGKVDMEGYMEFVSAFNEFINHRMKPFKAIIDKFMKL